MEEPPSARKMLDGPTFVGAIRRICVGSLTALDGIDAGTNLIASMQMADIRANYVEVARLAVDVLAGSQQLADGWRNAKKDLAPPAAVFGNSKAGPSLYDAHINAVDDADTTIDRPTNVLSADVDRLYRVAFAYEKRVAFAYEKQEADAQEDLYRAGQGGQSLRGAP